MKSKLTLLFASAFFALPIFGMTEKNQALFEKLTGLMKEEIQTKKVKDKQGNETENEGLKSILLHVTNTAQFRENELENNLTSVQAHFENSNVKAVATELRENLIQERKDADAAEIARLQAILDRAAETVKTSKDIKAFDPILAELDVSDNQRYRSPGNQEISQLIQKMSYMKTFVAQWQSYLAAMQSGDLSTARQTMFSLESSATNSPQLVFPRSELILLKNEIDQSLVDPFDVVQEIKTLDDLGPAIEKLRKALKYERPNQYSINPLLATLVVMDKSYREYLAGLPYSVAFRAERVSGELNSTSSNARLIELRGDLLRLILPRYIDAPEALKPNDKEPIHDYLKRLSDDAKARGDTELLARVMETRRTLANNSDEYNQDYYGYRSYVAGVNQETARQYELATASYQDALKSGSKVVPAEQIGDRLDAIKKDHPKEFAKGMESYKNHR